MEKNEETRRRRREADRLSRLPNDVLCRILSFLTTKQTVRTSVLSKRWTNLWLSVPDIEINDIFIWSIKLNNRFNNFLNSILIARDDAGTPFNRLSLDVGYGSPHLAFKIGFPKVLKSINFVLKRELKYLRLNLNLDDFDDCDNEYDVNERFLFKLPKTILNCKTLIGLDLSHFTFPNYSFSSDEFGFPSLKTLKLSDVNFDGNFALFLSGCPILEDLTMFQVWYARNNYTQFKSLSLSKLIKADIDDCSCDSFALHALSAAESLCLDTFKMHTQEREFYEEIKRKRPHSLRPYEEIPIFHNLTYLKLHHSAHLVVQILHHCPKLQTFEYQGLYSPNKNEGDKKSWVEPESVPQCLLSHLRTCTIWYSEGLQSQLILAKYILKNAYVLQTMKISSGLCNNISEKSKFSECPKASATCQLL